MDTIYSASKKSKNELATKEFVRAEINSVRTEINSDVIKIVA